MTDREGSSRHFNFFVMFMQKQMKYAWDIATEFDLSKKQLKNVEEISKMISNGGYVKDIKFRMRQLNFASIKNY